MHLDSNLHLKESDFKKFSSSLDEVQRSLTIPNPEYQNSVRFGKGRFFKKPSKSLCYLTRSEDEYILPRYMFGEVSNELPDKDVHHVTGRRSEYSSSIILRDYQQEFLEKHTDTIENNTGILIQMPCGHGKTVMAIYFSHFCRESVQTLVVVPTYYLAKQWDKAIKKLTTAKTHIVTSSDLEIPLDSDFTIMVADLFTVRVLPDRLINRIGHVILDEAHRMGAETYLPILNQIPAKYRTALTATFRRNDGAHKILKYHFGEIITMTSKFPPPDFYALRTGVEVDYVLSKSSRSLGKFMNYLDSKGIFYKETSTTINFKIKGLREWIEKDLSDKAILKKDYLYFIKTVAAASKLPYTTVDTYLNENSPRRKLILKVIQTSLDSGRTILVLSKRKDILKSLHKYFNRYKPVLIISETSDRTDSEEEYLQNKCRLIFGVNQLAKEGLDNDRLDTLLVLHPTKDLEQAIGRIARLHPDKKSPKALYLLDNHPMLYSIYNKAKSSVKDVATFSGEISIRNLSDIL